MLDRYQARAKLTRAVFRLPYGLYLHRQARASVRPLRGWLRTALHPVATTRQRRNPQPLTRKSTKWPELVDPRAAESQFICSSSIASHCRFVFNHDGTLHINESRENDWYYVTTHDVESFFHRHPPSGKFVLFSGYSDTPVDRKLRRFLRDDDLQVWFAVNALLADDKLVPIPIGIPEPAWSDHDVLSQIRKERIDKSRLFHVQFSVKNNPLERAYCLSQIGIPLEDRKPWEEYLRDLAGAYFCIAPKGQGIDTHRAWEALYLGTIPVLTRSALTDRYPAFPMIVLEDWAQFSSVDFSADLYRTTWGQWNPDNLLVDCFLQTVSQRN